MYMYMYVYSVWHKALALCLYVWRKTLVLCLYNVLCVVWFAVGIGLPPAAPYDPLFDSPFLSLWSLSPIPPVPLTPPSPTAGVGGLTCCWLSGMVLLKGYDRR